MSFFDTFFGVLLPRRRELQKKRRRIRAEVDALLARGLVEQAFLLPAEFGGPDDPRNITYLPPAVAARKRDIDHWVSEKLASGEDLDYQVIPEYDFESFVPTRLRLEAIGADTEFREVLDIGPPPKLIDTDRIA